MVLLKPIGQGWAFQREADLEALTWTNLHSLLGLSPLKQQYSVAGQFCDILAVDEHRQLVVIELKNDEDRYLVQQLTRYYHALIQEQPFADQVDYTKPIRLLAIAPSFHRDNFTDRLYSTLSIRFYQFDILHQGTGFWLSLQCLDQEERAKLKIPYEPTATQPELPPIPRKLLNWINSLEPEAQPRVLQLRQKLLSADARMREIIEPTRILYGKGKSLPCAELRLHSFSKQLSLFLWLPHPELKYSGRIFIQSKDWLQVQKLSYCPKLFRAKLTGFYDLQIPHRMIQKLPQMQQTKQYQLALEQHLNSLESEQTPLLFFAEVALLQWAARLT